jgi:hypothetical protein
MLTPLGDDGQKFVVAYVSWSNNKTKAKYIAHMKGSALQLFKFFHHFDVIFMVVHSLWSPITNLWNPYGIRLTHKKIGYVGTYLTRVGFWYNSQTW